jgi:hypothetical protein
MFIALALLQRDLINSSFDARKTDAVVEMAQDSKASEQGYYHTYSTSSPGCLHRGGHAVKASRAPVPYSTAHGIPAAIRVRAAVNQSISPRIDGRVLELQGCASSRLVVSSRALLTGALCGVSAGRLPDWAGVK